MLTTTVHRHWYAVYVRHNTEFRVESWHSEQGIEKYLKEDYIVVINRYTSSNMAIQGSKYSDSEDRFYMYQWIDKLEYWLLKLPKPDYTILLNMPYKYNNQISFDFLNDNKQEKVLVAYKELAELYNWDVIDCVYNNKEKTIDEIHSEILKKIKSDKNNYILSNSDKYIEPRTYRKYFNKKLKELKIKQFNFHSLRNTFATNSISIGCDYKTVSELLGHSNVNITLNLYVHPRYSQKKKCIDLISKIFQEKVNM